MNLPFGWFYSSSLGPGHPTGGHLASSGQPLFLVFRPNFPNSRRLLRQTGKKNPIIDLWPKDHLHGQLGCLAHHACSNSLKGWPVKCAGTIHSTFVTPPPEPATSSQAVKISPFPSPETMARRNVRVALAMGIITIIRSTSRLPSSRSQSHSAERANSRRARTTCVGSMLTSRTTLLGRAMKNANVVQSRGCRSGK